jgi:hypothetical protein
MSNKAQHQEPAAVAMAVEDSNDQEAGDVAGDVVRCYLCYSPVPVFYYLWLGLAERNSHL